uniref:Uncharacterized protein n=1 Tax=Anguilla anguilla TaxID=7936 RepID=A0A0E9TA64_ANGAN
MTDSDEYAIVLLSRQKSTVIRIQIYFCSRCDLFMVQKVPFDERLVCSLLNQSFL